MTKHISLFFFLSSLSLFTSHGFADAAPETSGAIKSPQQVAEELSSAQHDFDIAQKMFIPWYTGPLITGSANNVPFGHINIQPYLFFNVDYAAYNAHRKSVSIPNIYVLNPQFVFQAGLTHWLDVTVIPQAYFRWQRDHSGQNFGDLPLQFGFQVLKEGPAVPNIRFILGEVFPTGKYRSLDPKRDGLDATGAGVFETSFGLNFSKVLWWFKLHPIAFRLATQYVIADNKATVKGFNAYGGGYGTKGKVAVGNTFNGDLGIEYSINQKWVIATDLVYTYSNKSTFTGHAGRGPGGAKVVNGEPSSDQLSLSPAIEYNVTDSSGFIGGLWFSVYGRNSSDFVSGVLSYTVLF